MRAQGVRASPGSPRIQTVIRADPRKADVTGISDLKAAAFENVNLSNLELYIVMPGFACVRRKWFFSRFLCFFPLLMKG